MNVRLLAVRPDDLATYSEQIRPFVVRAAETSDGETTADELVSKAISGEFQMWAAVENEATLLAVLFTRIAVYPGLKSIELEGVAGDHYEKWFPLIVAIEAWARSEGCTRIRLPRARKGWGKKLPEYRLTAISLEKAL